MGRKPMFLALTWVMLLLGFVFWGCGGNGGVSDDSAGGGDGAAGGSSGTGSTSGSAILADHTTLDIDQIPQSDLDAARALLMSLDHASVGQNIHDGMDDLETSDSARYAYPNWDWRARGNPGWQAKVDQFVSWVSGNADDYDVFQMKFCFIDDQAQWDYYRDAMLDLESTYPGKAFIWWTMPITTSGSADRDAFNTQVRSFCVDNDKPLYDIAAIESHDPSGTAVRNNGYEAMYSGYTSDGGHLNASGRLRAAQGMWWIMARVAGWQP